MSVIREMGYGPSDPLPPPAAVDAEQLVIGGILADNSLLRSAAGTLRAEQFFEPLHRRIWEAVQAATREGRLADAVTLAPLLDGAGDEVDYLRSLQKNGELLHADFVPEFARSIIEAWVRRRAWDEMAELRLLASERKLRAGDLALRLRQLGEALSDDVLAGGSAELLDPSSWTGEPPERRWTVKGWMPAREVILFSGQGGTGKSLLLQQLLTSSAVGESWLGLSVTAGPAMGVFCEDDPEELQRRQWDINRYLGIEPAELRDRLVLWPRRGRVNLLATYDQARVCQPTALFGEVVATCKRYGIKLLVLDTLAHVFGGVEINRPEVTQFVSSILQRIADECDCTVLLAAHPSQSGVREGTGLSGSTAWEGSVRARLYLERPHSEQGRPPPDADERVLSRKKANYGGLGDEIRLRWAEGVLRPAGETGERPNPIQAIVDCMRELKERKEKVSPNKNANNYIVLVLETMELARNFTKAELTVAIDKLKTQRRLMVRDYQKSNRQTAQEIYLAGE